MSSPEIILAAVVDHLYLRRQFQAVLSLLRISITISPSYFCHNINTTIISIKNIGEYLTEIM